MNEPLLITADARGAPPPQSPPQPQPQVLNPRRPNWTSGLLWLLAFGLAIVVALVLLSNAVQLPPLHITLNGDEVASGLDRAQMPAAHKMALAGVVLVALLAALVIVPVAIAIAVAMIAFVALLLIGLPMLVVALVLGIVLSPLLLFGWLLWKAFSA